MWTNNTASASPNASPIKQRARRPSIDDVRHAHPAHARHEFLCRLGRVRHRRIAARAHPIKTRLVNNVRRAEVEGFVLNICHKGQQAYWVCPLIEESETLQLQTATENLSPASDGLARAFNIGLVHGRMKAAEKPKSWRNCRGRLNVLVATTVIEVGVDVPNAALMVIEHAERIGGSFINYAGG